MSSHKKLNLKLDWMDWTALSMIALLAVLYAWTLMDVPFHPDESTQIYMSKDLESLFRQPLSLSWGGNPLLNDEERIRAIDAPLAKYIIGVNRMLFSIPPLAADWDWSLSWEDNRIAGALPSRGQLFSARAAITALLPISLLLFYLAFKKILFGSSALIALILLGLNPLVLLHGRRAMSESALLLGISLLLWLVTRDNRNPWLIGLSLGICINAKHSALSLIPAAYLAVSLLPGFDFDPQKALRNILKTSLVFILITLVLNPFYWNQPFAALSRGIEARAKLARDQQEDYLGRGPELGITIPGMILNTYFNPIQTEEVGNYLAATQDARESYLDLPLHTLGRGILSGSFLFVIALAGIGRVIWSYRNLVPIEKNRYLIFVIATLGIGTFTAFLLPWQRYVVPLLPFTFGWIGAGLAPFLQIGAKLFTPALPD